MDKNVVKIEDFHKEAKKRKIKEKVIEKLEKGRDFIERNKGAIITIAPVALGGFTAIVKTVGKRINLNKEETLKDNYCYDRSLGHYWKLKRPLSNKEWLEIDRRKKDGERLSDILDEMRVLK